MREFVNIPKLVADQSKAFYDTTDNVDGNNAEVCFPYTFFFFALGNLLSNLLVAQTIMLQSV